LLLVGVIPEHSHRQALPHLKCPTEIEIADDPDPTACNERDPEPTRAVNDIHQEERAHHCAGDSDQTDVDENKLDLRLASHLWRIGADLGRLEWPAQGAFQNTGATNASVARGVFDGGFNDFEDFPSTHDARTLVHRNFESRSHVRPQLR
jgi:hypothetical protein